jgi:eukaryotic-like serine/threonine-protein kinase
MSAPGRKLGRYELVRRLAMGGMGEIYLAYTRGAGGFEKQVIIKTILPHLAEEEEFVTKFLDEGRIVVQLTHGNIVPVFDMGEEAGVYFIAMEYVPGLDLRAILKRLRIREEELPIEMALYIACEVCKGLSYAHRKSDTHGEPLHIVHRDVSPSNVLISTEGEIKIIDFGIARAAGKLSQTASGAIQGKCCYMSPEQARGEPLDARSDIFSTGILLYEMLTLSRPFEGRSDLESLELVRKCLFDPPSVLRPCLSDELDEILARTMAVDPDDRYETVDELYLELQQEIYRQGLTVTGQQLANCLAEVFADTAAGELHGGKPANLAEALELEFARLDETPSLTSEPLGLARTATSTPEEGTRTIAPTPSGISSASKTPATTAMPSREIARRELDTDTDTDETPDEPTTAPTSRRSSLTPVLIIVAIALIAALIIAFFLDNDDLEATLSLVSSPPGAAIFLDGEELAGRRTPQTLTLAPGDYRIELALDGHLPRSFRVSLEPAELVGLGPEELSLLPEARPPRTFTIRVDPEDATLLADGEPLDVPARIALEPGEVINLSATAEGCAPSYYTLSHGHSREDILLALTCAEENGPTEEIEIETVTSPSNVFAANRLRRVLINSHPSGADILVDEELVGRSPIYVELPENRQAIIEARRPGFRTYRSITTARNLPDDRLEIALEESPRGCLNFRTVYPANNEIAINGEWLSGRHMSLREHPLPEGLNRVTVRHPESGKEETFTVQIDAGTPCKVLTVWERE